MGLSLESELTSGAHRKNPASQTAMVYRFKRVIDGRYVSPRLMWGTLEAIQRLARDEDGWAALLETSREVEREALRGGLFFDNPPATFMDIESPAY